MNLQERDKRALLILAGAVVVLAIIWFATAPRSASKVVVSRAETIESAEKRLSRLREIAASAPLEQQLLAQLTRDLTKREKGLIQADTVGQAQSQLLDVVKRVAKNASPAVDIKQAQLQPPEPFGDAYGVLMVTVTFDCRIEQLVNMLADLTAVPELVASDQLRIGTANAKQKTMPVQLTVAGIIPRRFVPMRKVPKTL